MNLIKNNKNKVLGIFTISLLALNLLLVNGLFPQTYAKEGSDDSSGSSSSSSSNSSSGNSSSSSSSNDQSSGRENEQRSQESEVRGRESENEIRGRENENEVRGRESENELRGRENENEIRGREAELRNGQDDFSAGVNQLTFEIRGTISSISGNRFTILGRTIAVDPSKVVNFQQTTSVAKDKDVKVEGIIQNGMFFAREIKPLLDNDRGSSNRGPGSNRSEHGIEIEIENNSFEIRGTIDSVAGKDLTVFGQKIIIDPTKVINFQNSAKVERGEDVKIQGIIDDDGKFLAREIKPLEVKKVEIKENDLRSANSSLMGSIGNAIGKFFSSLINIFR